MHYCTGGLRKDIVLTIDQCQKLLSSLRENDRKWLTSLGELRPKAKDVEVRGLGIPSGLARRLFGLGLIEMQDAGDPDKCDAWVISELGHQVLGSKRNELERLIAKAREQGILR